MTSIDECSKSFETILYHSGKFGSYQRRLYAIVSAMHVVCSAILTYTSLVPHLELKQECREIIPAIDNDTFLFLGANETATYPVTCRTYYDNDKGLNLDWVFPVWAYPDYPTDVRSLIYYSKACGLAVGFFVGSLLSDYLGRRRVTYAAFLIVCAAQCSTGVSDEPPAFVTCQAFVGLGAGSFILTSMVLVLEYVGHDWRDICICLLPWWMGPTMLSVTASFTRHWRHLALVTGMMGLPLLGTYFLVLESSRWLLCSHKFQDAEQTTKEVVACNCRPVPELTTLFDISRSCVLTTMHQKKYTFLDLISTHTLRKGTLAVICTWLLGSIVYCGLLQLVSRITTDPYLNNFVLYSTDSIVIISAILINKCIGRRWCLFLYAMSSGLISTCVLVLHVTNESIDMGMVTWLGFFTKLGVTTSMSLINLVTMETYPTVVRTMGCAVGFLSALLGYVLTDSFMVYLEPFHYTVPFLVYAGMMALLAIAVLGFPETIRQPLPDILRCRHRNLCAHETVHLTNGWSN